MNACSQPAPRLLFGDAKALSQRNFQALADQFSPTSTRDEYDTSSTANFFYKGSSLAMDGLIFYHSVISNLFVSTRLDHYTLSLVFTGKSHVQEGRRGYAITAAPKNLNKVAYAIFRHFALR